MVRKIFIGWQNLYLRLLYVQKYEISLHRVSKIRQNRKLLLNIKVNRPLDRHL